MAIIPARGGSKRIPRKNIRAFAGAPIITYAIQAAQRSSCFDRIIVSTDDEEIAAVSRQAGAEVPFWRPAELANDTATTADVLLHATAWLRENGGCDYLCCIYPTVPLLDARFIRKAYDQLCGEKASGVFSVCRHAAPIQRAYHQVPGVGLKMIWPENEFKRSQEFEGSFFDAGQFYWLDCEQFLQTKSLTGPKATGIEIPALLAVDINTVDEWHTAELLHLHLNTIVRSTLDSVRNAPPKTSRVVLGTAQLGADYGVANLHGQPSPGEAAKILTTAWLNGIRIFDTAQSYGRSEEIIGEFLDASVGLADARVITKLDLAPEARTDEVRAAVEASRRKLRDHDIFGLLLHNENAMSAWGGGLGDALRRVRQDGLVQNLGISVYNEEFTRMALNEPEISFIQWPANIFDRRMDRTSLYREAVDRGKTIFVRSIFLQGLVMMEPSPVLDAIPHANEAVHAVTKFCDKHGISRMEFAVGYVKALFPEAFYILGAETTEQVRQNAALELISPLNPALLEAWDRIWPDDRRELINASLWKMPRRRRSGGRREKHDGA
ncbi:MAG TPA: pseudaminic acid cytidylyltransferase [Opitutaceae bacterium]|nr:pseudaminic acid cytidylyltransferase [Lacunisphaera sp.]HWA09180.1 pseudaminic acid cytidylyltransferase [Opitutaceae bacterium]